MMTMMYDVRVGGKNWEETENLYLYMYHYPDLIYTRERKLPPSPGCPPSEVQCRLSLQEEESCLRLSVTAGKEMFISHSH